LPFPFINFNFFCVCRVTCLYLSPSVFASTVYLSSKLYVSLVSVCLFFTRMSGCLSIRLSVRVFICLYLDILRHFYLYFCSLFVMLSFCLSFSLCFFLVVCLCVLLSFCCLIVFLFLYVLLSVCLSSCLCVSTIVWFFDLFLSVSLFASLSLDNCRK
jgi:hypothetical protein